MTGAYSFFAPSAKKSQGRTPAQASNAPSGKSSRCGSRRSADSIKDIVLRQVAPDRAPALAFFFATGQNDQAGRDRRGIGGDSCRRRSSDGGKRGPTRAPIAGMAQLEHDQARLRLRPAGAERDLA